MDGRTDRRTEPYIELLGRSYKKILTFVTDVDNCLDRIWRPRWPTAAQHHELGNIMNWKGTYQWVNAKRRNSNGVTSFLH